MKKKFKSVIKNAFPVYITKPHTEKELKGLHIKKAKPSKKLQNTTLYAYKFYKPMVKFEL